MSVQALLQRNIAGSQYVLRAMANNLVSIQAASTRSPSPQEFFPSVINPNTALQLLGQERARTSLPLLSRIHEYSSGLVQQNVANASDAVLSGAVRVAPFPTVVTFPSGVSSLTPYQLLSSAGLMRYQRDLGAVAYTCNASISESFRSLPPFIGAATNSLSSLISDHVQSRANAISYQRNVEDALAIIWNNESALRIHQLQLSQNAYEVIQDLYSAAVRNGANANQSASRISHIRNHAFIHGTQHRLSHAIDTSSITLSTEPRDISQIVAVAMSAARGLSDYSQSVAGRTVDVGAGDVQRPNAGTVLLATEDDEESLSEYQALVRKQLEFFEAGKDDVSLTTQGRKKPLYIGQVGIRCTHCAHRPANLRTRGSVYFPSKLSSVYQACQNMAVSHLMDACDEIDQTIRDRLCALRQRKDTAAGGKAYWASACDKVGVHETEPGLRLTPQSASKSATKVSTV